jgi:hypothetical protein
MDGSACMLTLYTVDNCRIRKQKKGYLDLIRFLSTVRWLRASVPVFSQHASYIPCHLLNGCLLSSIWSWHPAKFRKNSETIILTKLLPLVVASVASAALFRCRLVSTTDPPCNRLRVSVKPNMVWIEKCNMMLLNLRAASPTTRRLGNKRYWPVMELTGNVKICKYKKLADVLAEIQRSKMVPPRSPLLRTGWLKVHSRDVAMPMLQVCATSMWDLNFFSFTCYSNNTVTLYFWIV